MNIYQFKWPDNAMDWVFAPNKKEARKFYLAFSGCNNLNDCAVSRVRRRDWPKHYIIDINEPEPDELESYNEDEYHAGYKIIETFAEYAARNAQTDIICTTEF